MQVIKVTATGVAHTGKTIIGNVNLVSGSAAATIVLNDSLDGSGDDFGAIKTANGTSNRMDMESQVFKTGIYATITGAGASAYIYVK